MNNKGQALVEFVILIPVFMMLILGMVDLGNIIYHKYQYSNDLDYISDLYSANKKQDILEYANDKKIKYNIQESEKQVVISVNGNVKIITPGLNMILGNTYTVLVERTIYHE